MGLSLIMPAAQDPVSLAEAQDHVRGGDMQPDYLRRLVSAATAAAQHITERQFITATWRYTFDRLHPYADIRIPRNPVSAVNALKYVDSDGIEQTWDEANYVVHLDDLPARIRPEYGVAWPSARLERGAIRVDFEAGYGATPADVPEDIKAAILLIAAHLFENREEVVIVERGRIDTIPWGARALLAPYEVPEA